ncbi:MAG: flagellar basal-body rod protein FlgG [Chromatiales bacterium]|nr:flagellar basal-body rod protein FlgG [Chromatiales bacterium]
MIPALWTAKTGLEAQQNRLSVVSNNLANVNTSGFKRDRAVFEDLLYQNVRQVGANNTQETELPSGLQLGTGVRISATEKLHTQGNIIQTNNALDVAIQGRGFLQILQPDGTIAYTRDGTFQLNADGVIVTSNGDPLEPAITVPQDAISVTIGSDGIVTALQASNIAPTQLGNIDLADFVNPTGLQAIGGNLYRETTASGAPIIGTPGLDGRGTLVQNAVESSNVNVVEELVNMIETQRSYEMNSKAISTTDEMLQFVTQNL